jgi:hypothetical protein
MAGLIAATAAIRCGYFSANNGAPYPPIEMPHGADPRGRPTEAHALAHRDELVGDHRHGVVAGVGIPIAAASIDRHHRHGGQRSAVDVEGDRLGGRHPGDRGRVVPSEPVEHDHQRQLIAQPVPRRNGQRVADHPATGPRVEAARVGRAEPGERQRRSGNGARAIQLIELLLSREHPVGDELDCAGTCRPPRQMPRRGRP